MSSFNTSVTQSGDNTLAGGATEATQLQVLAELQKQAEFSETVWVDATGIFFIRRVVYSENLETYTVSYTLADGSAYSPTAPIEPASVGTDREIVQTSYTVLVSGTGYSIGDIVQQINIFNVQLDKLETTIWYNQTTDVVISPAPTITDLKPEGSIQAIAAATGTTAEAAYTSGSGTIVSILKGIFGKFGTLGQKTMSGSAPVTIASDQSVIPIQQFSMNFPVSTGNNSSAQLAAGATFTGTIENIQNLQAAQVQVTCDQNYTVVIKQYEDAAGTRLTDSSTFTRTAGNPLAENVTLPGNYFNLTVTNNGGSTTTTLKIDTTFGIMNTLPYALTNLGNLKASIQEVGGAALTLTAATRTNSIPVNVPDGLVVTGSVTSATSVIASTDTSGYNSVAVQVTSAGTTCTITYECSNDNTTFYSVAGYTPLNLGDAVSVTTSTTAIMLVFPCAARYFRAKVSTYGSGTVAATAVFRKEMVPVKQLYVAANGSGTSTGALRIVTSTNDTMIGSLTETAPATDTASSGLNGRLQRIAQRLGRTIPPAATQSTVNFYVAAAVTVDQNSAATGTTPATGGNYITVCNNSGVICDITTGGTSGGADGTTILTIAPGEQFSSPINIAASVVIRVKPRVSGLTSTDIVAVRIT